MVSEYEGAKKSFTLDSPASLSAAKRDIESATKSSASAVSVSERKIPLSYKVIDNSLIYISALPQMLRGSYDFYSAKSLRLQTQRLAEELNQFQLQTIRPTQTQGEMPFNSLAMLWNEVTVTAERPGWLTFKLSSLGFWYWLEQFKISALSTKPNHTLFIGQRLSIAGNQAYANQIETASSLKCPKSHIQSSTQSWKQPSSIETESVTQLLWQVQYSFACCCSLIDQTGIRPIANRPTAELLKENLDELSLLAPTLIPFARIPSTLRTLSIETVITIDVMYDETCFFTASRRLMKQAARLCQSFDSFYRGEWAQLNGFIATRSAAHDLSADTPYIHGVLKNLIAVRETLRLLLEQEKASESL